MNTEKPFRDTTLQEEFEYFMSMAFPSVQKGSPQWEIMEVFWNSSALLTCGLVLDGGREKLDILVKEAEEHCRIFLAKIKEGMN